MDPKQPPPDAQQAYLERLERSFDLLAQHQAQLGSPEAALKKLQGLREVIERLRQQQQSPPPAAGAPPAQQPRQAEPKFQSARKATPALNLPGASPDGPRLTWREFDAIFSFYEDAVDAIQQARHSVRHGKPLTKEPAYPADRAVVLEMIRRVFLEMKGKP